MSDRHNGWRETAGGSETQNSALVQPALVARVSHDGPAATRKAPAALARSVSAPPAGDAAQASRLTMVRLGLVAALDGLVADGTLPQDTAAKFKPMILDGPHVAVSCVWIAMPAVRLAHQKAPLPQLCVSRPSGWPTCNWPSLRVVAQSMKAACCPTRSLSWLSRRTTR